MTYSFFAMLGRMKHIRRWGLMHSSIEENLCEHTLETAYIAHALVMINNEQGGSLSAEKAVCYALYHDCSEIITGDLPTPVKYGNEDIRNAYKALEEQANSRLLSRLPDYMSEKMSPWFEIDKEYETIIKAADKLSALIKCIGERNMGNREFDTAYESTLNAIHALNLPEAEIFIEQFLPPYGQNLDLL